MDKDSSANLILPPGGSDNIDGGPEDQQQMSFGKEFNNWRKKYQSYRTYLHYKKRGELT